MCFQQFVSKLKKNEIKFKVVWMIFLIIPLNFAICSKIHLPLM